jgi:hypothetical protein
MPRSWSVILAGSALVAAASCGRTPPRRDFMKENARSWAAELAAAGGSFEAWEKAVALFHADVRAVLASRPQEIAGFVGLDGFLFFRRSLEVVVAGDFRLQKNGRDPFDAIVDFKRQLATRGIDLLFCPIPVKAAVMPEKFSARAPAGGRPAVNLYTTKLMMELAAAGVECVDLMPAFLAERDRPGEEPFYMPLDTHWSNRAVRVAARVFAERIKAYPWYPKVCAEPLRYTTRAATAKRRGDIVVMLTDAQRAKFPPMELAAEQVIRPDGTPYEDDPAGRVVFLGDSYSAVYQLQDCKHAGVSAHIARETGMPLDLVVGLGMGPEVRKKLARRGKDALTGKRLVIWALSERDLYNYVAPWGIVPMP